MNASGRAGQGELGTGMDRWRRGLKVDVQTKVVVEMEGNPTERTEHANIVFPPT